MAPSAPSRVAVHVVLRTSASISPDCRAVNRSSVATSTISTAVASPSTAAAITRQKSESKPTCSPDGSRVAKPGRSSRVPQLNTPAAWTASSVDPETLHLLGAALGGSALGGRRTAGDGLSGCIGAGRCRCPRRSVGAVGVRSRRHCWCTHAVPSTEITASGSDRTPSDGPSHRASPSLAPCAISTGSSPYAQTLGARLGSGQADSAADPAPSVVFRCWSAARSVGLGSGGTRVA